MSIMQENIKKKKHNKANNEYVEKYIGKQLV